MAELFDFENAPWVRPAGSAPAANWRPPRFSEISGPRDLGVTSARGSTGSLRRVYLEIPHHIALTVEVGDRRDGYTWMQILVGSHRGW